MKIYHYHPETKAYTGEGQADPNPKRKGDWLIPAFATPIKPPKPGPNQAAKFIEDKWILEDLPIPEPKQEPPPLTEEEEWKIHNAEIKFQIAVIEERQNRALREVILGQNDSLERLREIEEQIKQLRAELK